MRRRRTASILALTAAALASISSIIEVDGGAREGYSSAPVVVPLDQDVRDDLIATFDASWSQEARERAGITGGQLVVTVAFEPWMPEAFAVVATDAEGAEVTQMVEGDVVRLVTDATCIEAACAARMEVRLEGPAAGDLFVATVSAYGEVDVQEERDRGDLVGEVTLTAP